ncbi:3-oxoacyl-[acyl-carrier protein] reductase [Microbacterium sp. AK009]|uniref:SDR family NAD(P)-dependent oxidoreductase n=1 Tax=Microbacterium sp. AK009 TaxID=2723068 RepID=UPI0015CE9F48|nr:SDR family oxidoreductase [Microbacterium sp. AK009]NYF15417.1 3-oxoacyl-[acyl-carrier protein] reductase [Microbacterium sp. AK009]
MTSPPNAIEPLRCLVTGARRGIGSAIAARLAAAGNVVVGLDIETGEGSLPLVAADLADPGSRAAGFARALSELGGLDVLVNAAGVFRSGGVLTSTPAEWAPVWAVDLEAPLDVMRLAAPVMTMNGFGRIVNITSVHAAVGSRESLAYDVAKAGLEAATRSAALDLAPHGVLVNAVAPGFVRTRMSMLPDGRDETETEAFIATYVEGGRLPLGRPAAPAEVAEAVAFLAGRANTYVTGQVLTIDGGLTATF